MYDIHVRNNANNTHYAIIVDPGNGKVLYKQTLPQSSFGGAGYSNGMFGKGRMGSFFGGHDGRVWFSWRYDDGTIITSWCNGFYGS